MKRYLKTIFGFMERLKEDHVGAFATQAAYFILLSFIPFLMLLLTLVQYIPPISDQKMVTDMLLQIMPDTGEFRNFLLGIISEVYAKGTAVVPISAILALWSAGKGIKALTDGVNAIYHVEETRNYVVMRIRSAIYTLIFILGNITAHVIGMRTAISLCILVCIFLLIYKFLPNRKASLKYQIPGAVSSAVAWSLFSLGFSIYIDVYDGLSNMYGSLTTIILILLWLYFCMYIILIGAEINAYFEDRFRKLHQMASDRIRAEYREFLEGFREEDKEKEGESEEKTLDR